MSRPTTPAIISTGSALPPSVRTNDDPVFSWLQAHPVAGHDLFSGYDERRVLAPEESLVDLMTAAARNALEAAGVEAAEVDLLIGYASMSTWAMPNDLVTLGARLGVSSSAIILPVNGEYAIFNQGLVLADALLSSERAKIALVVVGADWSRRVSYHTPQSVSAGDGAGAAVLRRSDDPSQWRLTDMAVDSDRSDFGGMYLVSDATEPAIVPPTYGPAYFHLDSTGVHAFQHFGTTGPPALARRLLERHGLAGSDVTLIGHQASSVLLDAWRDDLQPALALDTLASYGNMTSASIPVNLDVCAGEITTSYLLLAALGPEPSCTAVLMSRDQANTSRSS